MSLLLPLLSFYTLVHYLHGAFGYHGYGDFFLMLHQVRAWTQTGSFPTDTAFLYPPFFYLLTAPLTRLSDPFALAVMLTLNQALLLLTGWGLWRTLSPTPHRDWLWVFVPLALNYRPVLTALSMAKIELFQLLLLVAVCEAYQRRQYMGAGCLLAVAGMTKPLPLILILYFLVKREWRVVVAWGCMVVMCLTLCAACMGWSPILSYFQHALFPQGTDLAMLSWTESQSLFACVVRWFHHGLPVFMMPLTEMQGWPMDLAMILRLLVATLIGLTVWNTDRSPQRIAGEWALALVGMILLSPFSRDYYAVFLLPAYVWLAYAVLRQHRWLPFGLGLASYLLVGQGFPLGLLTHLPRILPWANNLHLYLYYSVPTYGYLLLMLAWMSVLQEG